MADKDMLPNDAMSDAATRPTVTVCTSCRSKTVGEDGRSSATGAGLTEALHAAEDGSVEVREVSCLGNCNRGPTAVLQHPGRWTYIFGEIDPTVAGPELMQAARMLKDSADGLLPWQGRPASLKRGLIARVPPLDTK
ncbi:DUF1636 family protein [Lacibacterium aquatile]|uniref:DUF1636 family protein n=1 Tax=Lacibacterium aquatile TaxID=1168082 RepID=A0ABW5DSW3_9PROT